MPLSGPPSCMSAPAFAQRAKVDRREPEFGQQPCEGGLGALVVTGEEDDLVAVLVPGFGSHIGGEHGVEGLDQRDAGQLLGDPLAAGQRRDVGNTVPVPLVRAAEMALGSSASG